MEYNGKRNNLTIPIGVITIVRRRGRERENGACTHDVHLEFFYRKNGIVILIITLYLGLITCNHKSIIHVLAWQCDVNVMWCDAFCYSCGVSYSHA